MSSRTIVVLAHNIRSLWNVGSFFRTADAMGVQKLYLSGYTATPPRREISKTAIGAEEWIEWEYQKNPASIIQALKNDGFTIVGLEITEGAQNITQYSSAENICLVLGHEVSGIPEDILRLCNDIVFIPMHGNKESLNVSVAAGIALHELRNR